MKKDKLLIISRASGIQRNNEIHFYNLDGKYIDEIAQYFNTVTIIAQILKSTDKKAEGLNYNYLFQSKNIKFLEIPDYTDTNYTLWKAFLRIPKQFSLIFQQIWKHDSVFVMMSTYRGVFATVVGRFFQKKIIVYSGNDWVLGVDTLSKWKDTQSSFFSKVYKISCSVAQNIAMKCAHVRLLHGESLMRKYSLNSKYTVRSSPLINISKVFFKDISNILPQKLLFVGSLDENKGILYLVKAMSVLKNKCTLNIIGLGTEQYFQIIKEEIKINNLDQCVKLLGYIPNGEELFDQYRNSDIFVLPSFSEGFPRVLYEAMAFSLPIVCSDIPNIKDKLGEGRCVYIKAGNAQSIANGIMNIIEDTSSRQKMVEHNHEFIKSILENKASEQFIKYYNLIK